MQTCKSTDSKHLGIIILLFSRHFFPTYNNTCIGACGSLRCSDFLFFTHRSDWRWPHTPKWQVWLLRENFKELSSLHFTSFYSANNTCNTKPLDSSALTVNPLHPSHPCVRFSSGEHRTDWGLAEGQAEIILLHLLFISWGYLHLQTVINKNHTIPIHIGEYPPHPKYWAVSLLALIDGWHLNFVLLFKFYKIKQKMEEKSRSA